MLPVVCVCDLIFTLTECACTRSTKNTVLGVGVALLQREARTSKLLLMSWNYQLPLKCSHQHICSKKSESPLSSRAEDEKKSAKTEKTEKSEKTEITFFGGEDVDIDREGEEGEEDREELEGERDMSWVYADPMIPKIEGRKRGKV